MLQRFLSRFALRRKRAGYFSQFGGLWTDRKDAKALLQRKIAEGVIRPDEVELLHHWMREGFVILPGAVPSELIDRINAEVETVWGTLDPRFRVEIGGDVSSLDPTLRGRCAKLLDLYVYSRVAREAAFAPALRRFLTVVFERDPLLFQSLSFEKGSEQPIHQDTAFVVTNSPMEFAAAWISLEDIQPGSGELGYYPGSHRLSEHLFPGGTRNWHRERHGEPMLFEYLNGLHERAAKMGLTLQHFRPRKGDVLIWSADLAHGGSPIQNIALTRKSLVCHYSPKDVDPYYFVHSARHRTTREHAPGCSFASSHYALDGAG